MLKTRNPLTSLKLVHSIILLSGILLAGILIEFALFFSGLYNQWQSSKEATDLVYVSAKLDAIAHNHAVERGLTAGFLASNGEQFADQLQQQRRKADAAVAELENLLGTGLKQLKPGELNGVTTPLLNLIKQKAAVRQSVDALDASANAFDYYSSVNREALDAIGTFGKELDSKELRQQLESMLLVLWMKERAGQIRGKVNGILSSDSVKIANFFAVNHYILLEESVIKKFARTTTSDERALFGQYRNSSHWQMVSEVNQQFISGEPKNVRDLTNGNWFGVATQRIGDIKTLSDRFGSKLVDTATGISDETANTMMFKLASMAVLIGIIAAVNYFIITMLKKRITGVGSALRKISEHSDLTLRLNTGSNDEFGQIARAVDEHLVDVAEVFKDFKTTSDGSMSLLEDIAEKTKDSNLKAQTQHDHSGDMLASMNDISASSGNIANSMVSANDSMQSALQSASKSKAESEKMRSIFVELTGEFSANLETIEELANHSQEISSILDTISGIAEQTNLLALNAAIEAARAGEQGRGFAVVADEVRSLAQKTQESTANIRDMIERLNNSSQTALESMQHSQARVTETEGRVKTSVEAVESVDNEINNVTQLIQQVATAADEQSHIIIRVEKKVNEMTELSKDTLDNAKAVDSSTESLRKEMTVLNGKIKSFKV